MINILKPTLLLSLFTVLLVIMGAAVAATEGILRLLSADELEGVMAHELTHFKNRDIPISSIAATFAATNRTFEIQPYRRT
jgi:Zn-dependent protease with chaperone function